MKKLIYICLFLSGICGLSYEVIWASWLKLFIGSRTTANTIVLATFMGGLALGNYIFGRISDRPLRKLTLYALLELGIGFSCFMFPATLDIAMQIYFHFASPDPNAWGNVLLKAALAVALILVPTVFMGGTLPVLSKYFIKSLPDTGRRIGLLYFVNTAGAAVGCLLAGLYLIQIYGLHVTNYMMASLNTAIGILFLCLRIYSHRPGEKAHGRSDPAVYERTKSESPVNYNLYSPAKTRLALAAIFLSGILAMGLEVVWARLLGLVLGSSTYSFAVMLFTFIGGIAIGALLVAKIMKKERDAFLLFAICELGIFTSLVLLMPLYERLPYYFNVLASMLTRNEDTFRIYLSLKIIIAVMMMIVPTICIGMTLPITSRICVQRIAVLGRGVGSVFSVNTMGNVLGTILAGLVLIPLMDLQQAMLVFIILSGVIGAGLYILAVNGNFLKRYAPLLLLPAPLLVMHLAMSSWDGTVFNTGHYRIYEKLGRSFSEYRSIARKDRRILFHEDGPDASVVVTEGTTDGQLTLKVNGKTEAGTGKDMTTQLLLGHIPMLLHPDPRDVLLVGYGSGISAGAVLKHSVQGFDIVEISREVIKGAHFFDHINGKPLDDRRTRLIVADAKEVFNLQPGTRYYVIISQPSNPWMAGIANLYSIEFFRKATDHLKPGGILVQWIQLYDIHDATLSVIFNTLSAVLPYVTVWNQNADIFLIGSLTPHAPDPDLLKRRLQLPGVHADLTHRLINGEVRDPLQFLAGQMMSSAVFKSHFPGTGRLNSDYFPFVEFAAAQDFFTGARPLAFYRLDERFKPRKHNRLYAADYLGERKLTAEMLSELIALFSERFGRSEKWLTEILISQLLEQDHPPSAVGLKKILQHGNLSWYATRRLWQKRLESSNLSMDEWDDYKNYQFQMQIETASVFADPNHQKRQ
jgi:spermidine synthase/MFS family permease